MAARYVLDEGCGMVERLVPCRFAQLAYAACAVANKGRFHTLFAINEFRYQRAARAQASARRLSVRLNGGEHAVLKCDGNLTATLQKPQVTSLVSVAMNPSFLLYSFV